MDQSKACREMKATDMNLYSEYKRSRITKNGVFYYEKQRQE